MFSASKTGSSVCYIPSGKKLTKSLRFRSSASAYLNRTPASSGNQTTWTWSAWVKRGIFNAPQYIFGAQANGNAGTSRFNVYFDINNALQIEEVTIAITAQISLVTNQVFSDPSSWYHIAIAIDTTQTTPANRVQLYVNGNIVTSFASAIYPSQNFNTAYNSNVPNYFGYSNNLGSVSYFDGYLAEVNFIDGQALTPSAFGQFDAVTGVWQPISYTGTYGTNGFYLPFTDTSSVAALGTDFSGNGNTWTVNNISLTAGSTYDSMTDVPTLTSPTIANFATFNPITTPYSFYPTPSNGNLTVVSPLTPIGQYYGIADGFRVSSGKFYFEVQNQAGLASNAMWIGLQDLAVGTLFYSSDGNVTGASGGPGATYALGDVVGLAFDPGAGTVEFFKNGVSQGGVRTMSGGPGNYYAMCSISNSAGVPAVANINFGQQPFQYTPPTGFLPLNAYNLPCPTIPNGADYFDATLFTGSLAGGTVVNSGSMQPDFVWTKARDTAQNNFLIDSVRGGDKQLISNTPGAETTNPGLITSFNVDGFTYGPAYVSNNSYVSWQWKANGTPAVTNTAGTITSTVSANPTAGFSVVTYTGNGANSTVGHGLGIAPSMIIVKGRNNSGANSNWLVGQSSLGWGKALTLNTTNSEATYVDYWQNTPPTSSVFYIGTNVNCNTTAVDYVAYCWSQIPGFSAFGSYTGNGSTNGPFIYTGFRPAYVLVKRTDSTGNWVVLDDQRNAFNIANNDLYPNLANAEDTSGNFTANLLSNGFNVISTASDSNASGGSYIYAAFAENPFRYALAR